MARFCKFAVVLSVTVMALILSSQILLAGGKHNNAQQTVKCKSGVITAVTNCKENGGTK
jgi:hypothetical protein